ncbi:sulfur carrier protein ThiS [Ahrensia kielensis]|uniref:Sulfur carrier protein ThiS n=1 Tax=Ahrensia kielensis TaxID=76980 RepID=A0ABU9T5A1_9HYPH
MKLQLNGIAIDTDVTTLAALLDEQGFAEAKVATAVNGQFVPEALRTAQILDEGDLIEVLAPMQGG